MQKSDNPCIISEGDQTRTENLHFFFGDIPILKNGTNVL
nr:MAG TPA: hypothetical protein [Caudoviricetes sp.]DAX25400.1 MAG TPA: hypothetical protein [Caudoviricetes sp.]